MIPSYLLALFFTILGLYITAYFEQSVLLIPLSFLDIEFTLRLPIFLLIVLFILVRPIIQLYDSCYDLSEHHLRITRCRLSIWRRSQEFAFEDLLGVQVSQSIIDRILGVGSIEVGSKTSEIQIIISGIKDPQEFANQISRRIDNSRIAEKKGND